MSLNVLVIPEDFRKDQHLLKPIIEALLEQLGRSRANVRVCQNPRLNGISEATEWTVINRILNRYSGTFRLILLVVDRDGQVGRRQRLDNLESQARGAYPNLTFIAENAWQEVEVWALAGCDDLPSDWQWQDVRHHVDPKEAYFVPYSCNRGYSHLEHDGRKEIAQNAARNYSRIRQLCPEDLQNLETRIQQALLVGA